MDRASDLYEQLTKLEGRKGSSLAAVTSIKQSLLLNTQRVCNMVQRQKRQVIMTLAVAGLIIFALGSPFIIDRLYPSSNAYLYTSATADKELDMTLSSLDDYMTNLHQFNTDTDYQIQTITKTLRIQTAVTEISELIKATMNAAVPGGIHIIYLNLLKEQILQLQDDKLIPSFEPLGEAIQRITPILLMTTSVARIGETSDCRNTTLITKTVFDEPTPWTYKIILKTDRHLVLTNPSDPKGYDCIKTPASAGVMYDDKSIHLLGANYRISCNQDDNIFTFGNTNATSRLHPLIALIDLIVIVECRINRYKKATSEDTYYLSKGDHKTPSPFCKVILKNNETLNTVGTSFPFKIARYDAESIDFIYKPAPTIEALDDYFTKTHQDLIDIQKSHIQYRENQKSWKEAISTEAFITTTSLLIIFAAVILLVFVKKTRTKRHSVSSTILRNQFEMVTITKISKV